MGIEITKVSNDSNEFMHLSNEFFVVEGIDILLLKVEDTKYVTMDVNGSPRLYDTSSLSNGISTLVRRVEVSIEWSIL